MHAWQGRPLCLMTQEVMDPMTKVTGATDTLQISPMCHVTPTKTVPPMVHLEVVEVVVMTTQWWTPR